MRWLWAPAAVAAAVATLFWIEHADRAATSRTAANGHPTSQGEDAAAEPPGSDAPDADAKAGERGSDYIVAGRIVDTSGRPVHAATVVLRQGSG